ncbi:MAG TPA: hypothetical protein VFX38_03880, partial [Gammaproteobacteria bacterium]|nr:hypothetical protein [Gammaproteobacteria bacterium]
TKSPLRRPNCPRAGKHEVARGEEVAADFTVRQSSVVLYGLFPFNRRNVVNLQTLKIARIAGLVLPAAFLICVTGSAFAADSSADSADLKAVANFRLDDAVIAKFTQATKNIIALQKQHPELAKKMDAESTDADEQSIAAVVAFVKKYPPYSDAITRSGMSIADYVTCSFALIQTGMYATMGGSDAGSVNTSGMSAVQAQNVKYFKANQAKFEALSKLMDQLNDSDSDQ